MIQFINTRPIDRAGALTQALTQTIPSLSILELPLLELVAMPWSATLAADYQQLKHTHLIVVVSPTAVTLGMQGLTQAGLQLSELQHLHWIAVGESTAACLREYGIESHVPQVETSEGMLTLPLFHQLNEGQCVAFWRGIGGREFMMQYLQQRGIRVLNMVLYKRQCPEKTINYIKNHSDFLAYSQKYAILISSEASWLNWLSLLESEHDFSRGWYFVLGVRLQQLIEQYRTQYQLNFKLIDLNDLKPMTVAKALMVAQESS